MNSYDDIITEIFAEKWDELRSPCCVDCGSTYNVRMIPTITDLLCMDCGMKAYKPEVDRKVREYLREEFDKYFGVD